MNKITSFTVDHNKIVPGIYISRIDGDITTYDIRTRKPNCGDFMDNSTMHTVEHLFATYIRNSCLKDDVIYFGPMGCQTGFYLLLRNADNEKAVNEILNTFEKILAHEGEVFGCSQIECGNYKSLDLDSAKKEALRFLKEIKNKDINNLNYPK